MLCGLGLLVVGLLARANRYTGCMYICNKCPTVQYEQCLRPAPHALPVTYPFIVLLKTKVPYMYICTAVDAAIGQSKSSWHAKPRPRPALCLSLLQLQLQLQVQLQVQQDGACVGLEMQIPSILASKHGR